jgi:glycosyltransferase involved in cell wall biosynthesis
MTPRVAFVNGGILGLTSYADWARRTFAGGGDIHAEHFVLSEDLPLSERVVRRILCQRLWPDLPGSRNLDLARFRREMNAGLQARHRLLARGIEHFDVLHFHRQATAYASLDFMAQVPAIVSIDCTQTCVLQDAASAVERWSLQFNVRRDGEILKRAAAIVSTSRWTEQDVRRLYPHCRAPIHVMPNPVQVDLFDPRWIEERRARTARPQCLFMGGDFPRKGGPDLLEAWVRGEFSRRADLTVVTGWKLPSPLPPGVRVVTGIRAHTPAWIDAWRAADLFVMPTRNEAFGLVYQEAGAAGLPAIGSRLNAVPEIIDDGRTGLLVTPGNIVELTAALDRLISSVSLREQMGRAARAKVEQDANPNAHRARLMELIAQVADRGSGIGDRGSGIGDRGSRIEDRGSRIRDKGLGSRD